ncbi:MAG TPA: methylated-DNA--[protein]-cysteine S-methyltransferase [bacterium]|jgi:AraC family transcriptional regulator of adaptative response/methylated-DNA-[protein]-cysteine methyltransferase
MNTTLISQDVRLKAFYERDPAFAGLFFVGVKTTGIFCRVGCPARAPKPENISFYETVKEALDAGFRPCKVCKPLESVGETPEEFRQLLDEIHATPGLRLRNSDLEQRGIQPDALRRWFKKQHGITFQAYQRYVKIGKALEGLKAGQSVTTVALESYDSLSGFQESFKNAMGLSPSASVDKAVIYITRLSTPLGLMMAGAVQNELCLLEFCDRRMLPSELDQLQKLCNGSVMTAHCPLFDELQKQLDEYFAGQRKEFALPLHLAGTAFQKAVWQALVTIPYGSTCSYLEQARKLSRPEAVRAVAHANGMNRMAIVIPCHRVIGGDGTLTGYGGGLDRKRWLLEHEARYTREGFL